VGASGGEPAVRRLEKWSVWITSLLTLATGVGYFVTKYLFTTSDPFAVVNHPWQPFFLKAHILVSPLLLLALGAVAVDHVWKHFATGVRLSRRTALVTAISVLPMVLTGYLVQVLTGEGWVRAMAISHIAFGTIYGIGLVLHSWIVRRALRGERRSERHSGREWRTGAVAGVIFALAALGALLGGVGPGEPAAGEEPSSIRAGAAARPAAPPGTRRVRIDRSWPVMGTVFHATALAPDSASARASLRAAKRAVFRVDTLMSTYRPRSEVSRLNAAAGSGRWTPLSPETTEVLAASLRWSELSGGAFDPTTGPLGRVWGFHAGRPRVPGGDRLDSAARLVGSGGVVLDSARRRARLHRPGAGVDFGGIAKGYALDRAVESMRGAGACAGMVDLGGNVSAFGAPPPEPGRWRLGIRHPRSRGVLLGTVALDSGSVATSGDSEQFLVRDGVRYSHVMDPRTGRSARGGWQVTVLAPDGTAADALSTALFVMGPGEGERFLESEAVQRLAPGASALWVAAGSAERSPTFRRAGPLADRFRIERARVEGRASP